MFVRDIRSASSEFGDMAGRGGLEQAHDEHVQRPLILYSDVAARVPIYTGDHFQHHSAHWSSSGMYNTQTSPILSRFDLLLKTGNEQAMSNRHSNNLL